MTDFTDAQNAGIRLSNADRDEAVAQLNANLWDGRLNESEFAERSAIVRSAITRGELVPVFSDLPQAETLPPAAFGAPTGAGEAGPGAAYAPPPASSAHPSAPYPGSSASPTPPSGAQPSPPFGNDPARRGPIGGNAGVVAVSIAPIVALILFFLTGIAVGYNYSWLWFLLVPVVGAIVYGAGTRDRTNRR